MTNTLVLKNTHLHHKNTIDVKYSLDSTKLNIFFKCHKFEQNFKSKILWGCEKETSHSKITPENRKSFLWEETCFELFIKPNDIQIANYLEFNFTPNGRWNCYQFNSYRQPNCMPPVEAFKELPSIFHSCIVEPNRTSTELVQESVKEFSLNIYLTELLNFFQLDKQFFYKENMHWLANITAVIKTKESIDYYAQNHASPADFHNTDFWYLLD